MNIRKITTQSAATLATLSLLVGFAVPAFAEVSATADVNVSASATVPPLPGTAPTIHGEGRIMGGASSTHMMGSSTRTMARQEQEQAHMAQVASSTINRGDKEIQTRIDSLNKLMSRIGEMKRVSPSDQASFNATIQAQINDLTNLKTKIDGDAGAGSSTLKTDVQSITDSYRIYALVIPQGQILAAIDRIGTITTSLTTVGTKLSARISAASAAGKNVASLQTTLADLNAKVADATTQAATAHTAIASLAPDQGNTTVAASNKAALTSARTAVQAAQKDVVAATQDAKTIVKALGGMKMSTEVHASSTVTTSGTSTATSTQ